MHEAQRAHEDAEHVVGRELLEDKDAAARQERRVDPERRVLRGRCDERDGAGLDDGEELRARGERERVRSGETERGQRGGRRTASCCALLNRWISSMKRSVLRPVILRTFSASVKTSRSWAVVALVALSSLKMDEVVLAITRAMVVLPVPCR